MISVDFQSAPIITGEKVSFAALHPSPALALPAAPLWLCRPKIFQKAYFI
jgi:hypothetical protein